MRYTAIVIGAGPAGSTAARSLAQTDFPVLLIEKEVMPRIKPCGGALTHRALSLLPRGFEAQIKESPKQWTFQGAHGSPVTLERNEPYCHIVERRYFDQFLATASEAAGAQVHDGEAVLGVEMDDQGAVVITASSRYQADYVIAADGARGPTAKAVGFARPRMGAAMEAEVSVSPTLYQRYQGRVEIHIGQYPWGYAWVIPRNSMLNIGVGSFRARQFPLKDRFFAFCQDILGDSPVAPLAHPLPYRLTFADPVRERVLFCGDAAGYMDAFSAEGIYSALRSGGLAAQAVANAAQGHAPLTSYRDRLYQEFWPSLKSAVKMGLIFYPLAAFWSDLFRNNQALLSDYLDVAQGHISYHVLTRHAEHLLMSRRIFSR